MSSFRIPLLTAVLTIGVAWSSAWPADDEDARPSARIAREFGAARDWHAFAIDAMKRPDEGGVFHASIAANGCGMDMRSLDRAFRERDARADLADDMRSSGASTADVDATLASADAIVRAFEECRIDAFVRPRAVR